MKPKIAIFLIFLLSSSVYGVDDQFIDENEIKKWGYNTQSFKIEKNDTAITRIQFIKSIKQAKGLENHYYYYSLSEKCYSSYYSALKKKLDLIFLDEKDYTLSDLSGKCVRIINTSANFATFKEQPRVFALFRKYLNERSAKKVIYGP